jgi:hypothetical protein
MTTTNESATPLSESTSENDRPGGIRNFWASSDTQGSYDFGFYHEFSDINYVVGKVPTQPISSYYMVSVPGGESTELIAYVTKIRQYGEGPTTIVVVDFEEPEAEAEAEFDGNHWQAVQFLRSNGREVLASKLVETLRNTEENGGVVNIISMRDMVRLMVRHQRFADPFISPDDYGIVYAQWRTEGNGIVVMSFPGGEEIVLTAQADAVPGLEELDISEQGDMHGIIRKYGHLVPCRN